jgi:hypothetical protein
MTSFRPVIGTGGAHAVAPTRPSPAPADQAGMPSRRFEIAALMPCGTVERRSVTAPAVPGIEEAATAFARGTLLPTPTGPVAVEDLDPGDSVVLTEGAPATVIWIGSTLFARPRHRTRAGLVRVMSDTMGDAVPGPDLLLGPAARLYMRHARLRSLLGRDGVIVPLSDYTDGDRFIPVTPHGPVELYHLLLARHGLMRVGGLALESYHPGAALDALTQNGLRGAFMALFPNLEGTAGFGQVSASRTTRAALESLLET